jgi:hypothetical protein
MRADSEEISTRSPDEVPAGFAVATDPRGALVPVVLPTEGMELLIFTVKILWQLSLTHLRQFGQKPEEKKPVAQNSLVA